MEYLNYSARPVNREYRRLMSEVLVEGETITTTRQGVPAITAMQKCVRFNMSEGFPLITERSLVGAWRKAIGELCAFINGATTLRELEQFGCDWWRPWATRELTERWGTGPESLGPASYGGAFHDFPTSEGKPFDQFANLIEQIRELPNDRIHFITPWIPQWLTRGDGKTTKATVAPCHGWVHVRILNERLHLHLYQRAGDIGIGVPMNLIQYGALMLMIEHLTGYVPHRLYVTISDAHIYADQVPAIETMLARNERRLPTVILTEDGRRVTDIHDFRAEHFSLTDYEPHDKLRVPVANRSLDFGEDDLRV